MGMVLLLLLVLLLFVLPVVVLILLLVADVGEEKLPLFEEEAGELLPNRSFWLEGSLLLLGLKNLVEKDSPNEVVILPFAFTSSSDTADSFAGSIISIIRG